LKKHGLVKENEPLLGDVEMKEEKKIKESKISYEKYL